MVGGELGCPTSFMMLLECLVDFETSLRPSDGLTASITEVPN